MNSTQCSIPDDAVDEPANACGAIGLTTSLTTGNPGSENNTFGNGTLIAENIIVCPKHTMAGIISGTLSPGKYSTTDQGGTGTREITSDRERTIRFRMKEDETFGSSGLAADYHQERIIHVYIPTSEFGDIAVGILENNVTHITPISVATDYTLAVGTPVWAVGWGWTEDDEYPNDCLILDKTAAGATKTIVSVTNRVINIGTGMNLYDSGAGVFVDVGGAWRFVGVLTDSSGNAQRIDAQEFNYWLQIPGIYNADVVTFDVSNGLLDCTLSQGTPDTAAPNETTVLVAFSGNASRSLFIVDDIQADGDATIDSLSYIVGADLNLVCTAQVNGGVNADICPTTDDTLDESETWNSAAALFTETGKATFKTASSNGVANNIEYSELLLEQFRGSLSDREGYWGAIVKLVSESGSVLVQYGSTENGTAGNRPSIELHVVPPSLTAFSSAVIQSNGRTITVRWEGDFSSISLLTEHSLTVDFTRDETPTQVTASLLQINTQSTTELIASYRLAFDDAVLSTDTDVTVTLAKGVFGMGAFVAGQDFIFTAAATAAAATNSSTLTEVPASDASGGAVAIHMIANTIARRRQKRLNR